MKEEKITINSYFRRRKIVFIGFVIVTLILGFVAPLKSFILQWIIDARGEKEVIKYLILGLILISISFAMESISRNIYSKLQSGSIEFLRNSSMNAILKRSMKKYSASSSTSDLSLLTNDMKILNDDYFSSLYQVIAFGMMLFFALCMYIYIDPTMLLFVAIAAIAPLVLPKILEKYLKQNRTKFSEKSEEYVKNTTQILNGYEVISSFRVQSLFKKENKKQAQKLAYSEYKFQRMVNYSITLSSFLSNSLFFLVLMFGMLLVFEEKITLGYMVAATNLSNFVLAPCQVIAQSYARMKASVKIREKIEIFINSEEKEESFGNSINHRLLKMNVKNIKFSYDNSKEEILQDVNLCCEKNEKIALVGESGSGKSTLARILCGNLEGYSGEISFYDEAKKKMQFLESKQRIGYISQTPYIFNDTIRNNICLYEKYSDDIVENVLKQVGLCDVVNALEKGIDTIISENIKNLSGGQLQRIALARLIIRKYDLIIVDEITSSLDPETTESIMKLLLGLNCMVIVVTHDIFGAYMDEFDKVYEIKQGTLKTIEK